MSFEYNGVVYRDLEPQVRYDAEQVQLLKQADVTINENLQTVNESLQTINTEIDGKLTKPTNPSAESAVTMLADGTVGTKPLSEIGGGGKLYRHRISAGLTTEQAAIYIDIINTSNTAITENEYFKSYIGFGSIVCFSGRYGVGAVSMYYIRETNNYRIQGAVSSTENTGTGYYLDLTDTFQTFTDTYIEI